MRSWHNRLENGDVQRSNWRHEASAKLVTFYPSNAARGLLTHLALILLFRPETDQPLAIMDEYRPHLMRIL